MSLYVAFSFTSASNGSWGFGSAFIKRAEPKRGSDVESLIGYIKEIDPGLRPDDGVTIVFWKAMEDEP